MASRLKMLQEQLLFLQTHGAEQTEIEELEKKIARSKRGKSSKAKGSGYERTIAKVLMKRFPILDLARTPSSGGFKKSSNNTLIKGDITNLNSEVYLVLHLELKNQKTIQMEKWIKQSKEDCPEGKIPCVIFHQQQKIAEGKVVQKADDFICLPLEDFLSIVADKKIISEVDESVRK